MHEKVFLGSNACFYTNLMQGIHPNKIFWNTTMAFWGQVQIACSHTGPSAKLWRLGFQVLRFVPSPWLVRHSALSRQIAWKNWGKLAQNSNLANFNTHFTEPFQNFGTHTRKRDVSIKTFWKTCSCTKSLFFELETSKLWPCAYF